MAKEEHLNVEGMTCGGCENSVRTGLLEIPGVERVQADHAANRVEVAFDPASVGLEAIRERIEELGFRVTG